MKNFLSLIWRKNRTATPVPSWIYTMSMLHHWIDNEKPTRISIKDFHPLTDIRFFDQTKKDHWKKFEGVPITFLRIQ